jgi:hypothetical protein
VIAIFGVVDVYVAFCLCELDGERQVCWKNEREHKDGGVKHGESKAKFQKQCWLCCGSLRANGVMMTLFFDCCM